MKRIMDLLHRDLFELLSLSRSHVPFHLDGIGPNPWSLKLLDSGQTPNEEEYNRT